MSIYDFLLTIASQLGDAKPTSAFRRYPLRDLVAFYNEAMSFVSVHRPDLFTELTIIKLTSGAHQDGKCCGCVNVTGVIAQIDSEGNQVRDLTQTGKLSTPRTKWYRPVCKTTPGAGAPAVLIDDITIIPGMNGAFTVVPAIPPGADIWVKVKCVRAPTNISMEEVALGQGTVANCIFLPAIRSYILYRALQGDRHASYAGTEAQNEFRNVVTYLGIQLKNEERVEAQ